MAQTDPYGFVLSNDVEHNDYLLSRHRNGLLQKKMRDNGSDKRSITRVNIGICTPITKSYQHLCKVYRPKSGTISLNQSGVDEDVAELLEYIFVQLMMLCCL